jgi:hypothetical protein
MTDAFFKKPILPLFRNYDEHGRRLARPYTLLIDSEQLESGEALDRNFRDMAADEIDRFRREIVQRTGDRRQAERISDQDLLREVMNTVGDKDRLGESVRCVVSVSMLTEGWDANTVTHVLGVRAFGTQLLCEQVIGRALRRQSYDLNEEGVFDVEYADVLGIPFDFTSKPVVAPPQPPRESVVVKAVSPERDDCEISFPRVAGYRVELPEERLSAEFNGQLKRITEHWLDHHLVEAHASDFTKLGRISVLKARMNADLHMADDLKNTGKGNLFVIFGEPDIDILNAEDGHIQVKINGVDVFHPNTGEVRSDGADGIACWFIDTAYNEESFFVRQAYFLGANDPYQALKTTLKAEINAEAWATLHSDTSRPFAKPASGRIAVKVINHLGDEVMKVFRVD